MVRATTPPRFGSPRLDVFAARCPTTNVIACANNHCEMPPRKLKTDKRPWARGADTAAGPSKTGFGVEGGRRGNGRSWPVILGHLILRYTPTRLYSDYQGHKEVQRYEFVAADSDSVAIRLWDSLYGVFRP